MINMKYEYFKFTLARVSHLKHFSCEQNNAIVGERYGKPNEPESECGAAMFFG